MSFFITVFITIHRVKQVQSMLSTLILLIADLRATLEEPACFFYNSIVYAMKPKNFRVCKIHSNSQFLDS